eukprot:69368_1
MSRSAKRRRINCFLREIENASPSAKRRRTNNTNSNTNTKYDELSSSDEEEQAKWSCNSIRNKFIKLRQTPGFKITEWCKEYNVNNNSYNRFMKLKGTWNGTQNGTFWAATNYFKKQEKLKKNNKNKNNKSLLQKKKGKKEKK